MSKFLKLFLVALCSLSIVPSVIKAQGQVQQTQVKNYLEGKVFVYELLQDKRTAADISLVLHFQDGQCISTMDIATHEDSKPITYRIHTKSPYHYTQGKLALGQSPEAWGEVLGTGVRKGIDPTQIAHLKAKYIVDEKANSITISMRSAEAITLHLIE